MTFPTVLICTISTLPALPDRLSAARPAEEDKNRAIVGKFAAKAASSPLPEAMVAVRIAGSFGRWPLTDPDNDAQLPKSTKALLLPVRLSLVSMQNPDGPATEIAPPATAT
jgi:hypothetical protein